MGLLEMEFHQACKTLLRIIVHYSFTLCFLGHSRSSTLWSFKETPRFDLSLNHLGCAHLHRSHLVFFFLQFTVRIREICDSLASINVTIEQDEMLRVCLGVLVSMFRAFRTVVCTREDIPSFSTYNQWSL